MIMMEEGCSRLLMVNFPILLSSLIGLIDLTSLSSAYKIAVRLPILKSFGKYPIAIARKNSQDLGHYKLLWA